MFKAKQVPSPALPSAHLRRGSTHTEYVLIAAVVSVGIILAVATIGGSLSDILTAISDVLSGF